MRSFQKTTAFGAVLLLGGMGAGVPTGALAVGVTMKECVALGGTNLDCLCQVTIQSGSEVALQRFLRRHPDADTICNALASTAIPDNREGGIDRGGIDRGGMDMGGMNPGGMDPSGMGMGGMNPDGMNPGGMDPSSMGMGGMNPGGMDPGGMDPGGMGMGGMDPGGMDPGGMDPGGMGMGGMDPGGRGM
jgi:hypothetical protein